MQRFLLLLLLILFSSCKKNFIPLESSIVKIDNLEVDEVDFKYLSTKSKFQYKNENQLINSSSRLWTSSSSNNPVCLCKASSLVRFIMDREMNANPWLVNMRLWMSLMFCPWFAHVVCLLQQFFICESLVFSPLRHNTCTWKFAF